MANKSIQVRLELTAIRDSVACFGSRDQVEYGAVLEVAGSQESLARVDDAKQEELLAAYAQFLNSLTFPFQLVVQVRPVDLAWYVTRVEERARMLPPGLVAIARDHAAFVQGLTRQRTLLERRIYIVLPWSPTGEDGRGARPLPLLRYMGRRARRDSLEDQQTERVHRLLSDRCEIVSRQLSRTGLRATRLDDLGLAQLYHSSWAPEVARTQRLRRELADYTALVVGAKDQTRPRHRSWHGHDHVAAPRTPAQQFRPEEMH
jgi:hypothetical protein